MYQVFIAVRVFLYIKGENTGAEVDGPKLDAYLEEELYDTLVYCIQNLKADDFETKRKRAEEIGRELYSDGGVDAMENMFYSIEFRVKDEIGQDAKPYRSWWNGISNDWKY